MPETPTAIDNPIHNAIGMLAFLRSVIRSGEDLSEAEYEAIQKVIDALKAQETQNKPFVDESGTTWTRPTAWAYAQACATMHKMRASILNQCGDNSCWIVDEPTQILPRTEFLQSCSRYHAQIAGDTRELQAGQMTIAQLETRVQELTDQLTDQRSAHSKVNIGTSTLTRDLVWCECGRGLSLSGKWLYCPTCGSPIDQDSYHAAVEQAKQNGASRFYRDPELVEELLAAKHVRIIPQPSPPKDEWPLHEQDADGKWFRPAGRYGSGIYPLFDPPDAGMTHAWCDLHGQWEWVTKETMTQTEIKGARELKCCCNPYAELSAERVPYCPVHGCHSNSEGSGSYQRSQNDER